MKRFILLPVLLFTQMLLLAQGRQGHIAAGGGGGSFIPSEPVERRPEYPESLPHYTPPQYAINNYSGVMKSTGWGLLPISTVPINRSKKPVKTVWEENKEEDLNYDPVKSYKEAQEIQRYLTSTFQQLPFYEIGIFCIFYGNYFMSRQLPDRHSARYNLPQGYVVYKKDTIQGYITIDRNDIFIEQPVDSGKSIFYNYKMSNSGLKCVALFNRQHKSAILVRLNENDKKLWRIVHQGVVSVYDDRVGFIYSPQDVDKDNVSIMYNGEMERMTTFFGYDVKQALINDINSAYGYRLKPQNYNWNESLLFIDKLDE